MCSISPCNRVTQQPLPGGWCPEQVQAPHLPDQRDDIIEQDNGNDVGNGNGDVMVTIGMNSNDIGNRN